MDILSAVSGIITLLGASGTIVSSLEKLSSLREAPNTVLALNNEVSDFRLVIHESLNILQQENTRSSVSQAYAQNFDSVLRRARDKLVELECLIEYRLLAPNSGNEIRLNKTAWVLERHKIKRIQEEIRFMRISLVTMLSLLSGNSASRLQIQLSDLSLLGTSVQGQLEQALTRTELNFHSLANQLTHVQLQNEKLQLQNAVFVPIRQIGQPSQQHTEPSQRQIHTPTDDNVLPNISSFPGIYTMSISSTIQRRALVCTPLCRCRCHNFSKWRSPTWLQPLLGLLFTGYAGLPIVSPPCDEVLCRQRSEPTAIVQYFFPSWFAKRVMSFGVQVSKHGWSHSLRISRVVWNGSDLFVKTWSGDVEGVKAVLASRQGSPFDTDLEGTTALGVSAFIVIYSSLEYLQLFI